MAYKHTKDVSKSSTYKRIQPFEVGGVKMSRASRDIQKALEDTLGLKWTPAYNALRRNVLFWIIKGLIKGQLDICIRCGLEINHILDCRIDHKQQWLYMPNGRELFFDPDNIGFSHDRCNLKHRRDSLSIVTRTFQNDPITLEEMIKYNICPRKTQHFKAHIGYGLTILNVSPRDATKVHLDNKEKYVSMIDLLDVREGSS